MVFSDEGSKHFWFSFLSALTAAANTGDSGDGNLPAIIGGVVAGVVFLILIVILIVWLSRRSTAPCKSQKGNLCIGSTKRMFRSRGG